MKKAKLVPLEDAFASINEPVLFGELLSVLLSTNELMSLNNRWSAMQLLIDGRTQRFVRDDLDVSIATVSRAARAVNENNLTLTKALKCIDWKLNENSA